jgi:hypothetical protein
MTLYASLDYVKDWLKTDVQTTDALSADDMRLLQAARTVSRRLDNEFASRRPLFAPYDETRKFALDSTRVNSWQGTFRVDGHLLALTSTSINDTALADVEGYPDATMPPFSLLRLTDCCTGWYDVCAGCCDPLQVSVAGTWGFHRDYASAWMQVDALAAAIVSTSAATFTVANAGGGDAYGMTPRISAGDLLKVDSEYLEVTLVNFSTNVVTVRRGVNGSTAATHLINAPVYRWEVETPVKHAVARQVGLMYSRRGAYVTTEIQGMGEIRYPADFLAEVKGMLNEYAYI